MSEESEDTLKVGLGNTHHDVVRYEEPRDSMHSGNSCDEPVDTLLVKMADPDLPVELLVSKLPVELEKMTVPNLPDELVEMEENIPFPVCWHLPHSDRVMSM